MRLPDICHFSDLLKDSLDTAADFAAREALPLAVAFPTDTVPPTVLDRPTSGKDKPDNC
jgi:hypothetical protein